MDPLTLIVTALAAGAADVAKEGVKDAYDALKRLLHKKMHSGPGSPPAGDALADPEAASAHLAGSGAETDEQILEAARLVMARADPEGTAKGKYSVRAGKIGIVGDNAHVDTMNL